MSRVRTVMRDQSGGVGKFFLVFFGVLILLGVAGYFLWKPLILPLVGEAIPVRQEAATKFEIPEDGPALALQVAEDWVTQRGLFKPETALIQTPDLKMQTEVLTWRPGTEPSFAAALSEALTGMSAGETRTEVISEGVLLHYTIVAGPESETLIAAIGVDQAEDTSKRASALITVDVTGAELQNYLPSFAELIRTVEVKR